MSNTTKTTSDTGKSLRLKLGAVWVISIAAFVAQLIGAYATGSIVLIADTVHLFTDVLSLSIAFAVSLFAVKFNDSVKVKLLEAWGAFVQAVLLLGVACYATIRGLQALVDPHLFIGQQLLIFAAIGLFANVASVIILFSERNNGLNIKAAFLEVISDGVSSLLVLLVALMVVWFGFYQADSVAAFVLAALIFFRGSKILAAALKTIFNKRLQRLISAIVAVLLIVGFGLLMSGVHKFWYPSKLHFHPSVIDGYSWVSNSDENLSLTFDKQNFLATLSDGCVTAVANYSTRYGGVVFGDFAEVAKGDSCVSETLEIFAISSAYYAENLTDLKLYLADNETHFLLSSEVKTKEQETLNSWFPFWEFVFKL